MNLNTLRDVFHDQLKDMHSAEKQLTEALPKLAKAASSPELKQAFEQHLSVTEHHLATIRQIMTEVTTLPAKAGSFSGYARRNRPR